MDQFTQGSDGLESSFVKVDIPKEGKLKKFFSKFKTAFSGKTKFSSLITTLVLTLTLPVLVLTLIGTRTFFFNKAASGEPNPSVPPTTPPSGCQVCIDRGQCSYDRECKITGPNCGTSLPCSTPPAICVHNQPIVSITPERATSVPGGKITYKLRIQDRITDINGDGQINVIDSGIYINNGCLSTTFGIDRYFPSGWPMGIIVAPILSPGEYREMDLEVTSPIFPRPSPGPYRVSVVVGNLGGHTSAEAIYEILSLGPFPTPIGSSTPTPTPWVTSSPGSTPIPSSTPPATPRVTAIPSSTPRPLTKPVISTGSLPMGRVGRLYSAQVRAYDTNPGASLTMAITGLPTGLSRSTCRNSLMGGAYQLNCNIQGTPRTWGIYTVTVTARDNYNLTTVKRFSLIVSPF